MKTHSILAILAPLVLPLGQSGAWAQANTNAIVGPFAPRAGSPTNWNSGPAYHPFVIALDRQRGVPLAEMGDNANLFDGAVPWVSRIDSHNQTRYLAIYDTNTTGTAYAPVQNPLAMFGGVAAGTPLVTGAAYSFGCYAGSFPSNAFRIRVYEKSAFGSASGTVLPVTTIAIPIPLAPAHGGDTNAWGTFVENGFRKVVESPDYGLRTVLDLVDSEFPSERWGLPEGCVAYRLTHAASSDRYCFLVEQSGFLPTNTANRAMVVADTNTVQAAAFYPLFAMEFEEPGPWSGTYLDRPTFDAEPMPSAYNGKTVAELGGIGSLPPFSNPPNPASCTNLDSSPELRCHPTLDRFVADMTVDDPRRDALTLASFVLNEIELVDPVSYVSYLNGSDLPQRIIQDGGVNRGALGVFMERQGSPTEICALMVYLLRKAGIPSVYAVPSVRRSVWMYDFQLSRLLRMQLVGALDNWRWDDGRLRPAEQDWWHPLTFPYLPRDPRFIAVEYPWVAAYVDGQWRHIFPWLADTEVVDGYDLYDVLAPDIDGAQEWVERYVKADTNLLSLADANTPAAIFPEYVRQRLAATRPELSLDDIGVRHRNRKHQYDDWDQLPRPPWFTGGPAPANCVIDFARAANAPWLSAATVFDHVQVKVRGGGQTIDSGDMRTVDLHNRQMLLRFEKHYPTTGSIKLRDAEFVVGPVRTSGSPTEAIGSFSVPGVSFASNVEIWVDDEDVFDVEPDDLRSHPAGSAVNFTLKLKGGGRPVGWKDTELHVKFKGSSTDKKRTYSVGGLVMAPPEVDMILSLEAFRDQDLPPGASTTFANATGANNALLVRQAVSKMFTTPPSSLEVEVTHKRHRGYSWPLSALPDTSVAHTTKRTPIIKPGDMSAICLNFGRVTPAMLRAHAEKYWRIEREIDANKGNAAYKPDPEIFRGTAAYLMGMSYFERVSRYAAAMEALHKTRTLTMLGTGLGKFSAYPPDPTYGFFDSEIHLIQPNVDMFLDIVATASNKSLHPDSGDVPTTSWRDLFAMIIAGGSAEEHEVLNSYIAGGDQSISTVRLLQLAAEKARQNPKSPPIVEINSQNFVAKGAVKYGDKLLKDHDASIWSSITNELGGVTDLSGNYTRVLMTPGAVDGAPDAQGNASYRGVGALLLAPDRAAALISGNLKGQNGGYTFTVPQPTFSYNNAGALSLQQSSPSDYYLRIDSIGNFESDLLPSVVSFNELPSYAGSLASSQTSLSQFQTQWASELMSIDRYLSTPPASINNALYSDIWTEVVDSGMPDTRIRSFSDFVQFVYDPVSVLTGEFYHDAEDLALPGAMPLVVRRNYASQNLADNHFGYGWKLAHFPCLAINESNTIYAAEMDGSVVAYAPVNPTDTNNVLWKPRLQDNPTLNNVSGPSNDGVANMYLAAITNYTVGEESWYRLDAPDGSRRLFRKRAFPISADGETIKRERPYLETWQDNRSNVYSYAFYEDPNSPDYGQLRRIQSSSGNFVGFYYDPYGHITEAFTGDGRRLYYRYDDFGDLVEVTLPDNSFIRYDYEHKTDTATGERYSTHLIVREEKPDGRIVQNVYDNETNRRVVAQLATVGPDDTLVTNATFQYFVTGTNAFDHQSLNGRTEVRDAQGRVTKYYFDGWRLTSIVDPLDQGPTQEWYARDATPGANGAFPGGLKKTIDRRGLETTYAYDARGNVTGTTEHGDLDGDGDPDDTATTVVAYNALGMPTNRTDALGIAIRTYYEDGDYPYLATRIERIADGSVVAATTNTYTESGVPGGIFARGLLASSGSGGNMTTFAYDARGFLTNSIAKTGTGDPDVSAGFAYNDRGEVVSVTDAAGNSWRYAFDGRGNRTAQERYDATGGLIWWQYDYYNLNGELEWTDGPRFNPEDYIWRTYDGGGRPREVIRWRSRCAMNGAQAVLDSYRGSESYSITSFTHDALGNMTRRLDPNGNLTVLAHDAVGRVTQVSQYDGSSESDPLLSSESFTYWPGGEVYVHTDPLEGQTTTYYTSRGLPRRQENPDDTVLEWRYDLAGRPVRQPVNHNNYWDISYADSAKRVTRTLKTTGGVSLAPGVIEYYDARGNLVSRTDEAGYTTTSTYDGLDRLKTVTGPPAEPDSAQQIATYTYDAAGITNRVSNTLGESSVTIADPIGRPAAFEVRDSLGALVRKTRYEYPIGLGQNTTRVIEGTGAHSVTNHVTTDTFGNPVIEADGAGVVTRSEYDPAGNRVTSWDQYGLATRFEYDGLDRLVLTTLPDGTPTVMGYDAAGNLTSRRLPRGIEWTASYDSAGRIRGESLRNGGYVTRQFGYDYYGADKELGRLRYIFDPRGVTNTFQYDDHLRIGETIVAGPGANLITLNRAYDARGLLTNVTEAAAGNTWVIKRTHDGYRQLTSEETRVNGGLFSQFSQGWDAAGRRVGLDGGIESDAHARSFQYRADGLMTRAVGGGQTCDFEYADNGLLNRRSNPFRVWEVDGQGQIGGAGRDLVGRVLSQKATVGGSEAIEEQLGWLANSRLGARGTTRTTIGGGTAPVVPTDANSYHFNSRMRVFRELFSTQPSVTESNLYYFDSSTEGSLGVIAKVDHNSADDNVYLAKSVDGVLRITREELAENLKDFTATGEASGSGHVDVEIETADGRPVALDEFGVAPTVSYGPNFSWSMPLRLPPGEYRMEARVTHPSGALTVGTNSLFTVGGEPGGSFVNVYDGAGNLAAREVIREQVQFFTWDGSGRLIKVERFPFNVASNLYIRASQWLAFYDPLGRRAAALQWSADASGQLIQDSWEEIDSCYDPEVEFLELGVRAYDRDSTNEWRKVYGPDLDGVYGGLQGIGGLEAVQRLGGATEGVLNDVLGNVVATVPSAGVVNWNPCLVGGYGPLPGSSAVALTASSTSLAPAMAWRSRRIDSTGLYYLGARYYDPQIRRFISPDPMGLDGGMYLYAYAAGDPINFVDPDGRFVVGTVQGYFLGNWSSDFDSIDRPGRVMGRAFGTMLGYMTPGYNVVAAGRDIAAGGFHFGMAICDISVNGLNEENGMALAMSGLELAGGFAGAKMFRPARAMSSEMSLAGGSFRASRGFGAVGVDDALTFSARRPSVASAPTASAPIGGVCFVAGTPVATDDGPRAIETLRVGERVLTTDGDSSTEVDPDAWRKVVLRMPSPESEDVILDIELLRSPEWILATACAPGRQIWFEMEEMGLRGWAEVVAVEACPEIPPGQGRVILGTVTHCNSRVMEVRLEGEAEPLCPTAGHRLFSLTRGDWVPTSELRPGELLRTAGGSARVEAVAPLPGAHRVHNLEVETDHCYYVGHAQVLSHNTNPCAQPILAAETTRTIGQRAEAAVRMTLEAKGYTQIVQIQNASGHGIDIVARNRFGQLRFFEVKGHGGEGAARLSPAQQDINSFVQSRLERAVYQTGAWRKGASGVQDAAESILFEIQSGSNIRGVVFNVNNAASLNPSMSVFRWRQ